MKIAIDAMGGDFAPKEIIEGALHAAAKEKNVELILVGSEEAFAKYLPTLPERVETVISHSVMAMDESVENLRKKKDSSIFMATQLVAEKKADAIVSCGSTGAQMGAALLLLGRIKGVKRPAIVVPYPTLKGDRVLLDAGANADADANNLLDFAIMGNAYARFLIGKEMPEVVLLSNGTEAHKGTAVIREAHQLMAAATGFDFKGNIEGRDIMVGDYDVVVADGFTGNLVIKLTEGVASGLFQLVKDEITATTTRKLGAALVKPGLKNIAKKFDYSNYGGAPLLGVNGISLVCHGSSKANAVEHAIYNAVSFVNQNFVGALTADVTTYKEAQKQDLSGGKENE
jgi:glycerol-3-phosphate acyltransferase PlsX